MKWTTNITQVNIGDAKIYLSPILNMYNGEIISYSISRSPNLKMETEMLRSAIRKNKDRKWVDSPFRSGLALSTSQLSEDA